MGWIGRADSLDMLFKCFSLLVKICHLTKPPFLSFVKLMEKYAFSTYLQWIFNFYIFMNVSTAL